MKSQWLRGKCSTAPNPLVEGEAPLPSTHSQYRFKEAVRFHWDHFLFGGTTLCVTRDVQ